MPSDLSRRTQLPVRARVFRQRCLPAEDLVTNTIWAALRVGRDQLPPTLVLPRRVAQLVIETLQTLDRR